MPARTVPALLDSLLASDPSRPFVTFYDDASGERVELSVKSFANWVAKTANLVQDGLCAEPGERIAVSLPTHWQGAVWVCAAWSCGLLVTFDPAEVASADHAVVALDSVADGRAPANRPPNTTVAVSLLPLGGTLGAPTAGVIDYAAEVLGYPDAFAPADTVAADTPALQGTDGVITQARLLERGTAVAGALHLGAAPRLLTDASPCTLDGYAPALLAPLVSGGSVVLVRNLDPNQVGAKLAQERATAVLSGHIAPDR